MRLPSRTRLAAAEQGARSLAGVPLLHQRPRAAAEGKGLVGALRHFGLDTVGEKYKEAMRTRILQGRPYSAEEIAQILEYCMSDVVGLPALLERLLRQLLSNLDTVLHWGEFVAVSAAMEHRGVPINMEIASLLLDKHAWAYRA